MAGERHAVQMAPELAQDPPGFRNAEGLLVDRELGDMTVGVVGVTPALRHLTQLLAAFGARVVG